MGTRLIAMALLSAAAVGCGEAQAERQLPTLRFLSGIALTLAEDLVARYNDQLDHARVSFQPKTGSVVVVSDLQKGYGELGFVQADVVYIAYRRGIENEQYPHTNLRGLAVLWVNNLYIAVHRNGPIQSVADLRGRRVGILRPGTSGERVTRIVLGAYGMTYADIRPTFHVGQEILAGLHRGELDAAITSYPVPLKALAELAAANRVRLIPIGREASNDLTARYPFLRRVVVPALRLHQAKPVDTFGTEYLLVGRQDLPEELAYQLTKEFFDALPEFAARHAEAALIDPELAPTTPIPLHPGAARYYREREILK